MSRFLVSLLDPVDPPALREQATQTNTTVFPREHDSQEDQEIYRVVKQFYGLKNKKGLAKELEELYEKYSKASLRDDRLDQPGPSKKPADS